VVPSVGDAASTRSEPDAVVRQPRAASGWVVGEPDREGVRALALPTRGGDRPGSHGPGANVGNVGNASVGASHGTTPTPGVDSPGMSGTGALRTG
jgi:hypothetical protein